MVGDIFDWGNDQQTTCFMKKDPTWEEISVQAMQMSECLDVAEPGRKCLERREMILVLPLYTQVPELVSAERIDERPIKRTIWR